MLLQTIIVHLDSLLVSARDLLNESRLVPEIKEVLQSMPLLFERLWRYRHIVFRATRFDAIGGGVRPMLSDVQPLVQNYSYLYRLTYRYVN